MKIIQTLYNNSDYSNLFLSSCGWYAPEYNLMSWALSCLQLNKFHHNIHLFCNSPSAKMLIDTLKLPYSHIHVTHDKKNFIMPHPNLWALPKIYTYSLQDDPFLHVDGDVFIFRNFRKTILRKSLIAQNEETATKYYSLMQKKLMRIFDYFPEAVREDFFFSKTINAVNAGVLGGTDVTFFKGYTALAFKYINRNLKKLQFIDVDRFNIFFEQHLFYVYARQENKNVTYLINHIPEDSQFERLCHFWEAPYKESYLHLFGAFKKNPMYCKYLANTLRECYPDYYYRIISLFKRKNVRLKYDFYYAIKGKYRSCLKTYFNTSIQSYSKEQKSITRIRIIRSRKRISFDLGFDKSELLNAIFKKIDFEELRFTKVFLQKEYNTYIGMMTDILKKDELIPRKYLYGRDISAANWYKSIFENQKCIQSRKIVKCNEAQIISSKFNWGAVLKIYKQFGVAVINPTDFVKGKYLSIMVAEATKDGFSIFDIEYLQASILELANRPITIRELFVKLISYFDPNLVRDSLPHIYKMILTLLGRLILNKTIKPIEE